MRLFGRPPSDQRIAGRRGRLTTAWLVPIALAIHPLAGRAEAQSGPDPTRPFATVRSSGHTERVRSLLFVPPVGDRPLHLLSAGYDKVVNDWSLTPDGTPRVERTLRPFQWRSLKGAIGAIALSPALPDGQRILAVGGHGGMGKGGDIELYRYPGRPKPETGEHLEYLLDGSSLPFGLGHSGPVTDLAYQPAGSLLASSSMDGTVRIWDVAADAGRRLLAVLIDPAAKVVPVFSVTFTHDGRYVLSGDAAGMIRVWEVDAKALRAGAERLGAALLEKVEAQREAALKAGDQRRADQLYQQDAARRQAIVFAQSRPVLKPPVPPPAEDADDAAITGPNALVASPDGQWVAVGRESGRLSLLPIRDGKLGKATHLARPVAGGGAVEALAFDHGPRGTTRLASIVVRQKPPAAALNPVAFLKCDVAIRSMVPPGPPVPIAELDSVGYACAFSPDGHYLAYSGGHDQAIALRELDAPIDPEKNLVPVLRGEGRSILDIGLGPARPDGGAPIIAIARTAKPAGADDYWGLDIGEGEPVAVDPATLSRAVPTWGGYVIKPFDALTLHVESRQFPRFGFVIKLDPDKDQRWWSATFVPPTPEHPDLVVAVGCEAHVACFPLPLKGKLANLADRNAKPVPRSRMYAGPSGPVYSVAASADGRWLAAGGVDQTARLWRLDGCDRRPAIGARFEAVREGLRVTDVEAFGFADLMGLKRKEMIEWVKRDDAKINIAEVDLTEPNVALTFKVFLAGTEPRQYVNSQQGYLTSKRDDPVVSLFAGVDGHWVAWSPHGYYSSPNEGARKYLGWHRNGPKPGDPTAAYDLERYRKDYERPGVIKQLLVDGKPAAALAQVRGLPPGSTLTSVRQVPDPEPLPEVIVKQGERDLGPGQVVEVAGELLTLNVNAMPGVAFHDGKPRPTSAVSSVRAFVDGQAGPVAVLGADGVLAIPLPPNLKTAVTVVVETDAGDVYRETILANTAGRGLPTRLYVVGLGAGRFGAGVLALPTAAADVDAVAPHLAKLAKGFDEVHTEDLKEPAATADGLRAVLGRLPKPEGSNPPRAGDVALVFLETHFVDLRGKLPEDGLLGEGADGQSVSANDVTAILGGLARSGGCRVVLFLDALHEGGPGARSRVRPLQEWARQLRDEGVIVVVASNDRPAPAAGKVGLAPFAEGMVALGVKAPRRLNAGKAKPETWTALDLADLLEDFVRTRDRVQRVALYVPRDFLETTPIFAPPRPTVGGQLAKADDE